MGIINRIRFLLLSAIFFLPATISISQIKIGIALPLMSTSANIEEGKVGAQMLKGIRDALQEYNTLNPSLKINLQVEDTKKDGSTTLNIINEFGSDTNVIAILGPVYSSELINNVGASEFHKIPILTPTATQNFLAAKNNFMYQLNPTYDIRGRIIAKYAMNELKMKNFIIFAEESYGKNYSESFADEVTKNSGQIFSRISYSKNNQELSKEFAQLKSAVVDKEKFIDFGSLEKQQIEKLNGLKFKYSYIDSLIKEKLVVSIYKLLGKNADKILDSARLTAIPYKEGTQGIIFGYIDAVYIPLTNFEEISKIAPRYFSENINLPVIGTSDWNNKKTLEENRMYIKELYFDSDFYLKPGNNMASLTEGEIRNYYFGYDSMKLLLDKISEGNITRKNLNEALERVKNYRAKHNNITFKERTNHEMSIMLFKKGQLKKLSDYIY